MDAQTARLECLKAAAHAYASTGPTKYAANVIIDAAQMFERYVMGSNPVLSVDFPETSIIYDRLGNKVSANADFPIDLTGYTLRMAGKRDHIHLPNQHSDGKPPWCENCGLTKELLIPKSRLRPQHEFFPATSDLLICADCRLPKKDHTG